MHLSLFVSFPPSVFSPNSSVYLTHHNWISSFFSYFFSSLILSRHLSHSNPNSLPTPSLSCHFYHWVSPALRSTGKENLYIFHLGRPTLHSHSGAAASLIHPAAEGRNVTQSLIILEFLPYFCATSLLYLNVRCLWTEFILMMIFANNILPSSNYTLNEKY